MSIFSKDTKRTISETKAFVREANRQKGALVAGQFGFNRQAETVVSGTGRTDLAAIAASAKAYGQEWGDQREPVDYSPLLPSAAGSAHSRPAPGDRNSMMTLIAPPFAFSADRIPAHRASAEPLPAPEMELRWTSRDGESTEWYSAAEARNCKQSFDLEWSMSWRTRVSGGPWVEQTR